MSAVAHAPQSSTCGAGSDSDALRTTQNAQHSPPTRTLPALASGVIQAVLFNPVDRALYVRVKFRRSSFLDKRNFERPFQGFMNSAVYRTLVGSSYVFWQDTFQVLVENRFPCQCQASVSPQLNAAIIGLFAGMFNGLALNAMQTVKFRMWTSDERYITFMKTARMLYKEGGSAMFFRGCLATVLRDSVFGVVYEMIRHSATLLRAYNSLLYCPELVCKTTSNTLLRALARKGTNESTLEQRRLPDAPAQQQQQQQVAANTNPSELPRRIEMEMPTRCSLSAFALNLIAAVVASVVSAPLNYARVVIYGTPYGAIPLGYVKLLRSFLMQCAYVYRHGESYYERRSSTTNTPNTATTSSAKTSAPRDASPSSSSPSVYLQDAASSCVQNTNNVNSSKSNHTDRTSIWSASRESGSHGDALPSRDDVQNTRAHPLHVPASSYLQSGDAAAATPIVGGFCHHGTHRRTRARWRGRDAAERACRAA